MKIGDEFEINVAAIDNQGRTGDGTEKFNVDNRDTLQIDSSRTIYRKGEPIKASIVSTIPELNAVVELTKDWNVLHSVRVRLHDGHGTIELPYESSFGGRLAISAYEDFAESDRMISSMSLIYPGDLDLKVGSGPSDATFRPGDSANIGLEMHNANGKPAVGVFGVVLFDKAVEERWRTDQEFGNRFSSASDSLNRFLGDDDQLAGVSVRDLMHLDASYLITPDLDLLARVLVNQSGYYNPSFFESNQYNTNLTSAFDWSIKGDLQQINNALEANYSAKKAYPHDESELRQILSSALIDLDRIRDPWGMPYSPLFAINDESDVLIMRSAGPDKRLGTGDDIIGERLSWNYFRNVGNAIDLAVQQYHRRTGGFIRDFLTLRAEVAKSGIDLDAIRDRWGKPYRFGFDVVDSLYYVKLTSGGPDGVFAQYGDDFVVWASPIDYFAESRVVIGAFLKSEFDKTTRFPRNIDEFRESLRHSDAEFDNLRDPWNHVYYATFSTQSRFTDRVRIQSPLDAGGASRRTDLTPVTQTLGVIQIRSAGPDGKDGTIDDFTVATFSVTLAEQTGLEIMQAKAVPAVVLTGTNGAIFGKVTDPAGAAIPGVKITATVSGDTRKFETVSNDDGKFVLIDLRPGTYEVRFEATGFKAAIHSGVIVNSADMTEISLVLEPGAVTETVMITSDAPHLQTKSAGARTETPSGVRQISTPRLREYFPETLVWQPSLETDKQGRANLTFKLADNITTWKMLAIASTEDGRVGYTEKEIRSFQPFFVELDPPRILTEGDMISLPAVTRNYLDSAQSVELEIKPENWFSLTGPPRRQVSILSGDSAREYFDIRAVASVTDGKQRIEATGADGGDAIEKPVSVHPDGEENTATASDIIGDSSLLTVNVPIGAILGSLSGELKIYPNLFAHVTESVEAIMTRPYGCAEQTISSAYPGLMLLHNAKNDQLDKALRNRSIRYVQEAYGRLLNDQDKDGGFTYWGRGEPDAALTAYALKFLSDARDTVAVDDKVISESRDWLLTKQRADGSWLASEYWSNQEGSRATALLTAYIARVLASVQNKTTQTAKSKGSSPGHPAPDPAAVLNRALDYLGQRVNEIDEPYLLASYTLASLDSGNPSRAAKAITKLRSMAHPEAGALYWSLETNTPFYGWGTAGRVETTSLVVQALAEVGGAGDELVRKGLQFLMKHTDSSGVWYTTQTTVTVVETLLDVLARTSASGTDRAGETPAEILVNGRAVQTVKMPRGDALSNPLVVDIRNALKAGENRIEIRRGVGSSVASARAVAAYYVPWADSTSKLGENVKAGASGGLRLSARFNKTVARVGDEIVCHVEAERFGFHGYGMMLAEIGLPPGVDVDRVSLEKAMADSDWSISQYDVLPDRVVIYLWPRAGSINFDFKFRPRFGINAKSAASTIYDYYNPEARATVAPTKFTIE